MVKRTSIVNSTKVRTVSSSSVFQIGDSVQITPRNWALAVQRQRQFFYGKEGNFEAYRIFAVEIPHLVPTEQITVQRYNPSSLIKVNHIDITSVSGSSVYHIGSTGNIVTESHIKHIRQIERIPEEN
jgi:spore germination protein PE